MLRKPTALIMTATITPPQDCPGLIRKDPGIRMNDYCEALKFYLGISDALVNRIIFAENSNSDMSQLKELAKSLDHKKVLEFLPFYNGNDYPPVYGKGYGEMMLLDYVRDNSKILDDNDICWKATGRLVLANMEKVIKTAPLAYDLYCDLHNSIRFVSTNFFDPRFYSFSVKGYDRYFRVHTQKLKFAHIETYFNKTIRACMPDPQIVPRFKVQPYIKGYSGALDTNYFSYGKKVQRILQNVGRKLIPWVWV